jgi:hypothetical protein
LPIVLPLAACADQPGSVHGEVAGTASPLLEQLRQAPSVEAALATLSPAFFTNAVFAYSSHSLQGASAADPRVILPAKDGSAIVAYTGTGLAGGEHIEVIEFRAHRFRFADVEYSSPGATLLRTDPPECIECHRYKARPNFEAYFLWPGFYGSDDDNEKAEEPNYKTSPFELAGYQALMARVAGEKAAGHGRYRFVPVRTDFDSPPHVLVTTGDYPGRPNLNLVENRLGTANTDQIAHELAANPDLTPYRALIVGMLVCDRPTDLLPPDLAAQARQEIADTKMLTRAAVRKALVAKLDAFVATTGHAPTGRAAALAAFIADPGPFTPDEFGSGAHAKYLDACQLFGLCPDEFATAIDSQAPFYALRWLLERVVGIDTSPWSMAFLSNEFNYSFTTDPLAQAVLGAFSEYSQADSYDFACTLAKGRIPRDAALYQAHSEAPDPGFKLFAQCTRCHVQGNPDTAEAGYLPLDRPHMLARYIRMNPGLGDEIVRRIQAPLAKQRYHMPPGATLAGDNITAIAQFVANPN